MQSKAEQQQAKKNAFLCALAAFSKQKIQADNRANTNKQPQEIPSIKHSNEHRIHPAVYQVVCYQFTFFVTICQYTLKQQDICKDFGISLKKANLL